MANSVDPDQMARSGFALFAYVIKGVYMYMEEKVKRVKG
jgi:hypothetical protein